MAQHFSLILSQEKKKIKLLCRRRYQIICIVASVSPSECSGHGGWWFSRRSSDLEEWKHQWTEWL